MATGRDTVQRLAREVLGQALDPGRAEDAARRLSSLLEWVRGLNEERLRDLEPAAVFDPGDLARSPRPDPAWQTVRPPVSGTGYGAPPPGAARQAEADLPPRGVPIPPGPAGFSLAEVAGLVAARQLSAVEVAEACLTRAAALDPELKAFITVTGEGARAAAARVEPASSLLPGVPLAVKDIIDTTGVRTTCGSRILSERVPVEDADVVDRLRQAGAVLVGKTNTHEFAFGVTTANPHFGACRNPWNPGCIPGGSSGGSAVAVATGMCHLALGTDTAGSVRIPAACCGVVGLKPTYGLLSNRGIFPLSWSMDHPGILTRNVADAALALTALTGTSYPAGGGGLRGLKIGLPAGWLDQRVRPGVAAAVQRAIDALEAEGATTREVAFPPVAPLLLVNRLIVLAEGAALHRPWLADRAGLYGADVRARLDLGQLLPAVDYLTGQRLRRELCQAASTVMSQVDLLATPTLPLPAPRIGEDWLEWPEGREATSDALIRLTAPFNVTGQPAISIPCGMSEGRPVGLQLAGRWYGEGALLEAAAAAEAILQALP